MRLVDSIRACRRHLLAAGIFSALLNLLYIAPTLYMLQIYERVVPTQGLQTLAFLTLVLVFALITLALLDRVRTRLLIRAGARLNLALAPAVLDATIGQPKFAQSRQALQEFDGLRATLSGPAIIALCDAPWFPIYVLACVAIHPWIGLLALVGALVLPAIAWANERATRTQLERAQGIASVSYAHQDDLIGHAEVIRALGMRRALTARQMRHRASMLSAQTQASLTAGNFVTGTKFARMVVQSLALGLGALLAIDRQISPGAIFASSFLMARALSPIEQLIAHWRTLILARRSYTNLDQLIGSAPAQHDGTRMPEPVGAVRMENVGILSNTRDRAIIQGVTLDIHAGEVVAILGPSGAGKSTLLRTIAGAIQPDQGTVRLDGADMRDWEPEEIARHIGYLPQTPALLAGTIAENIARFAGETGMNRVELDSAVVAAARRVGAHDLILRLTHGYDHQLGLSGTGLSAGQAQRIGLARAVFGDPVLFLLDEPNAHLDTEADELLIKALAALKADGKTILIVSHKLEIMPIVDRILVMRDGRPLLLGPRQEVLAKLASSRPRSNGVAGVSEGKGE